MKIACLIEKLQEAKRAFGNLDLRFKVNYEDVDCPACGQTKKPLSGEAYVVCENKIIYLYLIVQQSNRKHFLRNLQGTIVNHYIFESSVSEVV